MIRYCSNSFKISFYTAGEFAYFTPSIATHLSENDATIEFIKDFLGHASIDTSQIYALKNKQTIRFTL
jgi:site-specific recombinase XerD